MNKKDYYETLGVSKDASDAEIKSAFRKLAKQYHPDVSKEENAEAKFKEIQEAYAVLSDEQKRRQYDQFGHAAFDGAQGAGGFGGLHLHPLGNMQHIPRPCKTNRLLRGGGSFGQGRHNEYQHQQDAKQLLHFLTSG